MDQQCRLEGQEEVTTGPDSQEQGRGSPSPNPARPGAQHHGQRPSAPCARSGRPAAAPGHGGGWVEVGRPANRLGGDRRCRRRGGSRSRPPRQDPEEAAEVAAGEK